MTKAEGFQMRKEQRLQERKEFREYLDITDDRVLDVAKAGIELVTDDEVFVQVKGTEFYWISNQGRLVNDIYNNKKYRFHKTDSGHKDRSVHYSLISYDIDGTSYRTEWQLDKLVAEHFLIKQPEHTRIWHIDEDCNNNFYKNLVWVTNDEYERLRKNVLKVEDLGRQQEYIFYNTIKGNRAYNVWNGIYIRCYEPDHKSICVNKCYEDAYMCDAWKNDRDAFAEWFNANYYECDGERMMVDKDLLCRGNKEYAPDKCCILPQVLNSALASATKRIHGVSSSTLKLPIGVRYDECRKKYYASITPFKHDETIKLSYWDTPEEAFQEYKKIKEAEILILAVRYKNKIPSYIYDALTKYEVRPFGNHLQQE